MPGSRATGTRSPASSGVRVADLDGKVAIVTGASAGIGEAPALGLAAAGARVAVCARRHHRLEALVARIRSAGGEADAHALDVTDARWGRVDLLVSNLPLLAVPAARADERHRSRPRGRRDAAGAEVGRRSR